ncbi:MAG: 2,3,4,5-tetrahydropyridine-2,6-dicarboxylate N-succinyltransferase [Xanthomonadales bacterium]|nr:2,3,4,5-tetrahydropyridine-2,6-dicarboxylate N-succinyltransferase [Gammaproteobacteria bacterium]MBT8053853.1 2,3,4,5-tetrahydropyridine-2,6-dicarboxylate N-succinyltransferase [Gammaproteobacteria bacterium]NND58336.1 2,3,4,5-tetrahydropyridine-2,6-dicarboxylate N-succinyltransferase [Xanthomonadales bacterium]NNK51836.1 2,3,4,5-tetrahydropyridine-2,6-dicarboxylate N-succinyltransferase [Xanthomonadales bacterium]
MKKLIESAWQDRAKLSPGTAAPELREAVEACLDGLEAGRFRVAEPLGAPGEWKVNQWLKKAVLLSFRLHENEVIEAGFTRFFDKLPLRWSNDSGAPIEQTGARVVPPATVRRGAHIAHDAVLMPSYVNIGAYVGKSTMVDTWATVGSCAQIGANVHLSGGVGIGGVLEPLQANPTIIEDDCFIGARSEVVEGVIVERGSVLSMGVYIGQSTRIYNRETGEISRGRIPSGSVVVPGSLPAADGSHSLYCAVIVKQVDEKTRASTGVNEILRHVE